MGEPDASGATLSQSAANVGVAITRQGLAQRFSVQAGAFLLALLQAALGYVLGAPMQSLALLERFNGVYVLDSTRIQLPAVLSGQWSGGKGKAALKISLGWELRSGRWWQVHLHGAVEHDQTAPMQHTPLPQGALRIADLGYFRLETLRQLAQQGAYWLTRYKSRTALYNASGQPVALLDVLAACPYTTYSSEVFLGKKTRVRCRLLAQRVTADTLQRRRAHLRETARRKQQKVSMESWQLAVWTVYVTNVPATKLNLNEALQLAAYRWQIELLFKLWKDEGQIDTWVSQQPQRILCEVYAKLLSLLIQHSITLACCWHNLDRSLVQAHTTLRLKAWQLASVLTDSTALLTALQRLRFCLSSGCRVGKSRRSPRSHQRLLAASSLN
jgi:hypothetical protein